MNTKEQLFFDKIQSIFNIICQQNLTYFTNYFYIKDPIKTEENREIYLKNNWLKKPIYPRMFIKEYMDYPFSKLTINGKPIFQNGKEFLEMDIDSFSKRIKAYTNQEINIQFNYNTEYKYMYVFNMTGIKDNTNHIDYYYIDYLNKKEQNGLAISVTPPQNREDLNIELYSGFLRYQEHKIIINFENRNDYISAIFNTDLINTYTKYLVGVAIGIADINQKIPVSKKVILTKEIISDIDTLYPILNETEMLIAKENSFKLTYHKKSLNDHNMEKYIDKVDRLDILFRNLNQKYYFDSFYKQLILKEFSSINNIFQKMKKNSSYYITNRKRVLDILLKSYTIEKYQSIFIVMPIYDNTKD